MANDRLPKVCHMMLFKMDICEKSRETKVKQLFFNFQILIRMDNPKGEMYIYSDVTKAETKVNQNWHAELQTYSKLSWLWNVNLY